MRGTRTSLDYFNQEETNALVEFVRKCNRQILPNDLRVFYSNHMATVGNIRRGASNRPDEVNFLKPLFEVIRELPVTALLELTAELRSTCDHVRTWNAERAQPTSEAAQEGPRPGPLFRYFGGRGQGGAGALNVTKAQCDAVKQQLDGAFISYRPLTNGNILKSIFLIPGPSMPWFREGWADSYLPPFLHWLRDQNGRGRYVIGHIIPLQDDIAMIGFVAGYEPNTFVGVKIITFAPQRMINKYQQISGPFFSKYISNNYEGARCTIVRATDELRGRIEEGAKSFLNSNNPHFHDRIEVYLKGFMGTLSKEDALRELAEYEIDPTQFRKNVVLYGYSHDDEISDGGFWGPVNLGH